MTEEVVAKVWKNGPISFYMNIENRELLFKVFGVPLRAKGTDYKNLLVQLGKEKEKELIVKNV